MLIPSQKKEQENDGVILASTPDFNVTNDEILTSTRYFYKKSDEILASTHVFNKKNDVILTQNDNSSPLQTWILKNSVFKESVFFYSFNNVAAKINVDRGIVDQNRCDDRQTGPTESTTKKEEGINVEVVREQKEQPVVEVNGDNAAG